MNLIEDQMSSDTKRGKTILTCLNAIVKSVGLGDETLSGGVPDSLQDEVEYIAEKFHITRIQSILLAVIAESSGFGSVTTEDEISRIMGLTNLEMMNYFGDLNGLARMRIVRVVHNARRGNTYALYSDAREAILENREFHTAETTGLSIETMFSRMRIEFSEYFDGALDGNWLSDILHGLINSNRDLLFCQKVLQACGSSLPDEYFNIFLYMCHRYVSHGQVDVDVSRILELIPPKHDIKRYERDFIHECTPLHLNALVQSSSEDGLINQKQVQLCETVRKEFFSEISVGERECLQSPDIRKYDSIVPRNLFYNEEEQERIQRLEQLLDDENFRKVQHRLRENGMRDGVNIIMYGLPGTGKTESCYQLARKTGRDLYVVDIAGVKSKYVGDSEKQVRDMFRYYAGLVKNSPKAPILLLNEADALLGLRKRDAECSSDKMNNTLQNIFLQEMESINGILIATTNMEIALDPAFERRFLVKIRFGLPTAKIRERIWKDMLSDLSDEDAKNLALSYQFSGGQIENVVRKSMIRYVIDGIGAEMTDLTKYCDEELFSGKTRIKKIGYI